MAKGFLKGFMPPSKGLLGRAYPGKSAKGVKGIAVFGGAGYGSQWGVPVSKVERIPNKISGRARL